MLLRIVSILFPLVAVVLLGYVVARRAKPDLSDVNKLNMDVFTPALILSALAARDVDLSGYGPMLGAMVAIIVGSGLVAWAVARLAGIQPKTLVPPMMFNNVGNLGLPIALLAFGEEALAPAAVMLTVTNVMHFSFGAWLLDHHTKLTTVWRSPLIIAAAIGLAIAGTGTQVWPPLLTAIRMIGDMSIPLMLFALGARIATSRISALGFGVFGAVLRPVVGMLLAWLLLQFIDLPDRERGLLWVFGALPPAVLNYMFAERYNQEPDKVASMVLLGNIAALIFLPVALALALK